MTPSKVPDPRPRTLLLTGFGPFPGVPVNASAELAENLARAAGPRHPGIAIHVAVLPTEWDRGLADARAAIDRFAPDVIVHFGVSDRARGFVIESQALNACCALPDASGCLAPSANVERGGPNRRPVTLPVADIMRALREARVPVSTSNDAGEYLCNAVLYQSLGLSGASNSPFRAGFIHIPTVITDRSPLSAERALQGGLALIEACLGL